MIARHLLPLAEAAFATATTLLAVIPFGSILGWWISISLIITLVLFGPRVVMALLDEVRRRP